MKDLEVYIEVQPSVPLRTPTAAPSGGSLIR